MRLKHIKGANEIIIKGRYFVDNPLEFKGKWHEFFGNNNPIYIEIGMGKGDFIIENAVKYPNINFIGIERYDSVILRAVQKSNELELDNLKLIRIDAIRIDEIFEHEIDKIYLNFSDPWPKDRHAKRRLTSSVFLSKYDTIFKKDALITMKTDNNKLFEYSIDSLKDYGYDVYKVTRDLYKESDLTDNIATEYEKKFVSKGISINKLETKKKLNN